MDISITQADWTINGIPHKKADPRLCQIILTDANACHTCPLNVQVEEESQSPLLNHILYLDELKGGGVNFGFDDLMRLEWRGLSLLARKRNAAEVQRFKNTQKK